MKISKNLGKGPRVLTNKKRCNRNKKYNLIKDNMVIKELKIYLKKHKLLSGQNKVGVLKRDLRNQ